MEPSHDPSIPEAYAGQRDRSLNNDEYTSMNAATNERFLIVTESALEHASPSTRSILLGHSSSSLMTATLKTARIWPLRAFVQISGRRMVHTLQVSVTGPQRLCSR